MRPPRGQRMQPFGRVKFSTAGSPSTAQVTALGELPQRAIVVEG